jgi:exodeoxyribonuclease VII large subunit
VNGDPYRILGTPPKPLGGVLSVSELTARIKDRLEGEFGFVQVEGEISNHKIYASGHRYFSLKDAGAQVRVVLFRGRERAVFGDLRDGQTAIVTGALGVYEKRGEYQIYAQSILVRGLGSLLLELEKRKERLAAEGLFDPARKRPLPPFPRRIGIVTSRQGAALRDMIRIARQRWPAVGIVLAPALVQGDGAAPDIARALSVLAAAGRVDLVIVGRGGGSVEDLWAFNEEAVVRAVAAFPVPTISAVGHETDFTLADLAADVRASTPTAAAQMAVPDRLEFAARVSGLLLRARRAAQHRRETARRDHRIAAGALADPRPVLQARRYAVADLADSLLEAALRSLRERRERALGLAAAVRHHAPDAWAGRKRGDVSLLSERAHREAGARLAALRGVSEILKGKLTALDPRGVLTRGYAIVTRRDSESAVRSVGDVRPGDLLDVRVFDGTFGAAVEDGNRAEAEVGKREEAE